ncbi:MAG TPA: response regulator, partial [Thermoanaerobaculia bacterium]|nr:response regulator [Thermoanaerobaculia bacterium]
DDSSFRVAICRLLRAAGYRVREYASAGEFLMTDSAEEPGCILLDLRMPGPSGLDLQESLAKREPSLPIIFLTAHGDVPLSVRAMKGGAADFLAKPVLRGELLAAIDSALTKDAAQRAARSELLSLRSCYDALSPREREVLQYVVAGRLNKQIASVLGTSERTVKAHRARVMEKMRASSVADLVRASDRLLGSAASGEPRPGSA